ncbi:InlB B-repeat-containing protein [Paracholeplasma manati]|uniref:InlB B-repeat-containing protein n=1 Tax=Paracholeplasma manati TaxID=591373 RepID=UPI002407D910|nr:InlB B-repeat-containing protein [Paracholeplasma manati]MDG0889326.1 InlB B-repeat-containing protein [Paracholeplasma manati]
MRKLLTLLAFLLIFLTACNQTAEIKITFIENGGVELEDLTIKTTDTSVTLPTPVRDGYTFDGWFTDEDLTLPFTIAALLTQSGGITLYAKWTQVLNQFTVTYQTNGGSNIAPVSYTSGETMVEPAAPTKEGYTFNGWYGDSELTQSYTFGPMPDSNLTLYAKWTINQYTITFESNGGSTVTALTGDYQTLITKPINPIKVGYTFIDWYLEPAFTTPYVFNTMGSSNITLYAKWQINTYTVTFESNQGSAVPAILTEYNTAITQPNDPTKIGHTFGGWFSDQTMTVPFVFTTQITQNITLYAKWNINSYTMTFNSMGGSPINPVTQPYGSQITVPNPVKEGYDFAGWYTSDTYTTLYTVTTMPDGSMTVYAKWTASPYTITFDSNGGTAVTAISANYNDVVTKPENPTKMGHTFVDWYSDSALTTAFVFNTMPVGGATLFAKWTVNEYTITFVVSGGTEITPMVAGYDTVITAPTTTKPGYVFQGWYTEAELNNAYTFDKMGASDITLYAKWQPLQYSIQFMSNGGSNVDTIYGILDETITKPEDPTKQGYTFDGWYTESVFTSLFVWDKMPLEGATLYAKWTINTYTLTYIIEGSLIPQEIAYQSEITFMTPPEVEGYTFVGWLENSEPFILTLMPDRDVTILPKYEVNYYTISFGNITKDPISVKYADPIAIVEPTAPMGYAFTGWYVDEFFLTEFEGIHMPAKDIVLYAQFEALAVSLYLHVDALEVNTLLIGYGDVYKPNEPFKEGYQFLGWFLEDTYLTRVYEVEMGLDPIHLYAKWQIDEGYDLIETILVSQPSESVKVKGIISYIFERPGFPGFYLYDGTGNIFVLASPAPFVVGDVIEFDATYDNFENTPQLINPTGMILSMGSFDMPAVETIEFDDVMRMDESNPYVYGQMVTMEAFLGYGMGGFYLQAPFSDERIMINYRSIVDDSILMPYINQTVRIDVIIHDYQGMANLWHVAYIGNSINPVTYTPEDIVNQVIQLGIENLEGKSFYPGAQLQLPNTDSTYGVSLSWSTVGENSAYFNLTTFTFEDTEIERQIGLECIITYQGLVVTHVFTVTLKPVTFLTYAEFVALDNNEYAMIKAVVLAHIPMIPATIVSLDGNPIFVPNNNPLNPGDEVVLVGYKQSEMGMYILANDPDQVLVEITQTGLPMPQPTDIPIDVFSTLPGNEPLYWFKYVRLTGILQFDPNSGYYFIVSTPYAIPLLPLDQNGNQTLSMYIGMPVSITGFTVMNFDMGGTLHMGYLNMPGDIQPAEIDPQEKIDLIYYQLLNQFIHTFYHPGDTIELPITDKLFGSTIVWHPVNDSNNYINFSTGLINPDIEEFIAVELEVVITLEDVTATYTLFIHIQPELQTVDIATLQLMPITEVMMFVQIASEPVNGWMLVWDGVNYMGLYSNRMDVHQGDMIQIQGQLISIYENNFIGVQGDPIIQIIQYGEVDTSYKVSMSIFTFNTLDLTLIQNQYKGIELVGMIGFNSTTNQYYIEDSGIQIPIMAATPDGMMAIHMALNQTVTIGGYALLSSGENHLLFYNDPDALMVNQTDETIVEMAKQHILSMHNRIYRPGEMVYLETNIDPYYPNIIYILVSSDTLFDINTGAISMSITEPTDCIIEVTITYQTVTVVFELTITVEPLVFSTVEAIQMANIGDAMNLDAIVLFRSTDEAMPFLIVGDATGYMLILGKHYFDVYDRVQFQGMVVDYEGELALKVDAYQTLYISSNNTPMTPAVPMSMYQATQVGPTDPWATYIVITGTVSEDMGGIQLYDEDTSEVVWFKDINEHQVLKDYTGLKITIKAFIHYDDVQNEPVLYYGGGHSGIQLAYTTDEEKMAALIGMGYEHFEYTIYHPYQRLDMPEYFDIFDAYLTYEILDGFAYINDYVIQLVESTSTISLQVTALIGTYQEVVVYTITIEPYNITSIIDVSLREDGEFVVISGTVRALDDMHTIVEDPTGMIVLEGFGGYNIDDVILVYGYVNYVYGTVQVNAYGYDAMAAVIGFDDSDPTLSTISLYDTGLLDPNGANLAFYTTYEGHIENRDGIFFLTNGIYDVQLIESSMIAHDVLLELNQQLVSIQVYFVGIEMYGKLMITALFTGEPLTYQILTLTAEDITAEILNYAVHAMDHPYYTGEVTNYPIEHPYFHGTIQIINDGINQSLIGFNQGSVTVSEVTETYQTDITIEVTYIDITYSQSLTITLTPYPIITLQEAQMNHLGERVFLKVIIASMQFHFDTMVYVKDASGFGYFITMTNDLHPFTGVEMILSGFVYEPYEGMSYIDQVVIHQMLLPIPLGVPMVVPTESLIINQEFNGSLLGQLITIQGILMDNGGELYLSVPGIQIVLLGNVTIPYQNLQMQVGQVVEITGIVIGYRIDFFNQQIIPMIGYIPMV